MENAHPAWDVFQDELKTLKASECNMLLDLISPYL